MNDKWKSNDHNSILEMEDGYLSWVTKSINMDNEPELAICDNGTGKMAILYGAKPEDFENFNTFTEAIQHATSLVNDNNSPVRAGFWTSWDFDNNQWY